MTETTEETTTADTGVPEAEERRREPLGTVAVTLVVIAALVAGWSVWSWYGTAHDESLRYAKLRDEVLQSGTQAIRNLNTMDYRAFTRSLKTWLDSTTGDLRQDIERGRPQFEQQVTQAKKITTAKVLEAAVTELDTRAGKARLIVAVRITVTPATGPPTDKLSRLVGELSRTNGGWKLSTLGQAPVGGSGQ